MEEKSDFKQLKFAPGYPKRITGIKCFCHVKNPFDIWKSQPAPELCKRCKAWEAWYDAQYERLCRENGIPIEPKVVDLFGNTQE